MTRFSKKFVHPYPNLQDIPKRFLVVGEGKIGVFRNDLPHHGSFVWLFFEELGPRVYFWDEVQPVWDNPDHQHHRKSSD